MKIKVNKIESLTSKMIEELEIDINNIVNIIEYDNSGISEVKLRNKLSNGSFKILVSENHDSLIQRIQDL